MPQVQVTKTFRFEAAHFIPAHAGNCARMHGHSYVLEVAVAGAVGPDGMVIDFDELGTVVREHTIAQLDHTLLNDRWENPTVENVALAIWAGLRPHLPALSVLTLHETRNNRATVTE